MNYSSRYRKVIFIIIGIITMIGLLIRLKGTLEGLFAFTFDQGRDLMEVNKMLVEHKLRLISNPSGQLPEIFYGPWWYWFLAAVSLISSGNPQAFVIAFALIYTFIIPIAYFFGSSLGGRFIGIFFVIMFAFSPPLLGFSAQFWNPNLPPALVFFAVFFLWLMIKKKNSRYLPILAVFTAFVFEFHMAFGALFIIGMTCVIIYLRLFTSLRIAVRNIVLSTVSLIVFLPQVIFEFRHNFLMSRALIGYAQNPPVNQIPLSLRERFISRLVLFFDTFGKTLSGENRIIGAAILVVFIIVMMKLIRSNDQRVQSIKYFVISLNILLTVLYLGFVIYPDVVWSYYLSGMTVIFIILSGIIVATTRYIAPRKAFIIVSFIILIAGISPLDLFYSVSNSTWEGDASVYRNQKNVIDRIYEKSKKKLFSVEIYTPSVIPYPYQYLFLWHGKKQYGYIPEENQKLVFYIIEKDEQPWRRELWLHDHAGDGKITSEEVLPGGIILQQRQRT